MSNLENIYIVWHESPMGGTVLAVCASLEKAKAEAKEWDEEHTYYLDKARITKHRVIS